MLIQTMELLENEVELVNEVCKRIKTEEERLKPKRRLKILDIGCGTGKFSLYLREETGCEVTGIDPVGEKIEKARTKSSSVTFEVQSAEEMSFANNTFDFVASLKALHEIPNHRDALKESKRVLKGGGKIFIIDWVGGIAKTQSHAHAQKYFTPKRLKEALSEAGFGSIHVETNKRGELMLGEGKKLEAKITDFRSESVSRKILSCLRCLNIPPGNTEVNRNVPILSNCEKNSYLPLSHTRRIVSES